MNTLSRTYLVFRSALFIYLTSCDIILSCSYEILSIYGEDFQFGNTKIFCRQQLFQSHCIHPNCSC